MKKIIAAACAAAFLLSAGCSEIVKTADYSSEVKVSDTETVTEAKDEREPLNYGQQVGMWLPYVKFPDYMQGRSEEDFRKAVREMLADAQAESVNTIYFHVRPNGDAYYASELFPKGEFLDGDYDPLAIVIDEAHKMLLQDFAADKTCTLCELADMEGDIDDPFGGDLEDYEKTADKLYIALTQLSNKIEEIQENQGNPENS